ASGKSQLYVDVGAGSGMFTHALASLLGGGKILAIDKDERALKQIPSQIGAVQIETLAADFMSYNFEDLNADGILMANALHFVSDKAEFLLKVRKGLKTGGVLVVVEYE